MVSLITHDVSSDLQLHISKSISLLAVSTVHETCRELEKGTQLSNPSGGSSGRSVLPTLSGGGGCYRSHESVLIFHMTNQVQDYIKKYV